MNDQLYSIGDIVAYLIAAILSEAKHYEAIRLFGLETERITFLNTKFAQSPTHLLINIPKSLLKFAAQKSRSTHAN